jgi:hypothetical protein
VLAVEADVGGLLRGEVAFMYSQRMLVNLGVAVTALGAAGFSAVTFGGVVGGEVVGGFCTVVAGFVELGCGPVGFCWTGSWSGATGPPLLGTCILFQRSAAAKNSGLASPSFFCVSSAGSIRAVFGGEVEKPHFTEPTNVAGLSCVASVIAATSNSMPPVTGVASSAVGPGQSRSWAGCHRPSRFVAE